MKLAQIFEKTYGTLFSGVTYVVYGQVRSHPAMLLLEDQMMDVKQEIKDAIRL